MKPLALRDILVATDFEADAVTTLDGVFELAALAESRVHIVHAGVAAPGDDRIDAQIKKLASALNRPIDVSLLAGPPAAAITQEAARTQADVIVLGHHRNRAGAPGSTADRVVRTARMPCLILPGPLRLPLSSVLVPVQIGAVAGLLDVALTWASALRRRGPDGDPGPTRVDVLYVHAGGTVDEHEMEARLRSEVNETRQRLAHIAGVEMHSDVVHDTDIPPTILAQADDAESDLLVLGTRAQRLASDPLGSVSSAVVSRAQHPVLLVPPELWRPPS